MNYIEFIRLKENLLLSLFNSAYSAQIYCEQTKLYGKDSIYKELLAKPGNFEKGFLNLLLNMENIQFSFDMKDLGDSKIIILNHSRLDELWVVAQYFLLHEVLLQSALHCNYFHILEVMSCFPHDYLKAINVLKTGDNQKSFFNIIEKKTQWLVQAKINPLLLIGKTPKGENSTPQERIKGKMESVFEFVRQVKHYIIYETLRVQSIKVAQDLRKVISKMNLENSGIFEFCPAYNNESDALSSSRGFDDFLPEEQSGNLLARDTSFFYEKYFDNQGRLKNIFIVPATSDLLRLDLDDLSKGVQNEEEDYILQEKINSTQSKSSFRGGFPGSEDGGSPKARPRKYKKTYLFKTQELYFLNWTSISQVLEVSNFLLQTLNLKILESTLDANPLDSLLLHTNGFEKQPQFQRNKIRINQSFDTLLVWMNKFKEHAQNILSFSNPKERTNELYFFLRNTLKREFLTVLFASIETLNFCRHLKDTDSLIKIRRFLIKFIFNSTNHLYKYNDKLCYHKSFNEVQKKEGTNEVDINDSDVMKIINFIFIHPSIDPPKISFDTFFGFIRNYSEYQASVSYGMFDLKKPLKSYFGSKLKEVQHKVDQLLAEKNILSNYQPLTYIREANNLLKHNVKFQLMRETYLFIQANMIPFSNINEEIILECQNNIQYHFSRAQDQFSNYLTAHRLKTEKNSLNSLQSSDSETVQLNPTEFQSNFEKINLLKAILKIEVEKLILKEGISFYMQKINKSTVIPRGIENMPSLIDTAVDKPPALSNLKELNKENFLPFLYSFTNKILNKGLFIDALNVGECVVIPTDELEHELFELNSTLLEYFDQMKFETQQKYQGKISVLQNELGHLNKEMSKTNQILDFLKKDQERIIEARVAEINSNLIFECDMLKKRIKYILEEQDFTLREMKWKIREEFRNKIIDNEVSLKKMNNKYHEYKEGMSFDIRKFLEIEKNNTLRMIREKKNQIFQTQPREIGNLGDSLDFEDYEDSEIVAKLYALLKKTRVLYKFREACLREEHDEKINEMEKQLLANQDLLNKVNDLQTSDKSLKEELTDLKKELAVVENHNNTLRKALHHDQKQKIRLYKKNNETKSEITELQTRYGDALKQKAILIPSPRPETANSFASYRYHFSSARLFSAHGKKPTADSIETENLKVSALEDVLSSDQNRKLMTSQMTTHRPKHTLESPRTKLPTDTFFLNSHMDLPTSKTKGNSSIIKSSFIETKSPQNQNLFGFNIKTGKKVKKNDSKGFLLKKFQNAKESQ